MTYLLQELLGNDHPLFVANLNTLEKATGSDGVDVRLLGDIIEKGHAVLRTLGLDPAAIFDALQLAAVTRGGSLRETDRLTESERLAA